MAAMIKPIPAMQQRQSLGDQVYASIRDSIVTVKLEPGSMLYENELAEALGVSRTPIREAIRLLANEQLVEVLPQRGTRIALISERKVSEVQFIREQLELGAFRLAAQQWNEQKHRPIKEEVQRIILEQLSISKQPPPADESEMARFLELDEQFHQMIMKVINNETLMQIITQMRAHLNRVRYLSLQVLHNMPRIVQEHTDLLQAIEQNNAEFTVKLLQTHIGKMNQVVRELRSVHPQYFRD